jgi:hypothetical protein
MYLTGQFYDLESRIKSTVETTGDLNSYVTECQANISAASPQMSGKWEKELRLRKFGLSLNSQDLLTQIL